MDTCSVKCIDQKKVNQTLGRLPEREDIARLSDVFKALSEPSRLTIVMALLENEHCVCDIGTICNQTDSAVSHQLRLLRNLGIVKNRRDGKIVYYSIANEHVVELIRMSLSRSDYTNK